MKDCKDNKKGCKYCKHNRERTIRQQECKRGHRALYGFGCRDFEINKYEIGQQVSIYDILDEQERIE